ncbi:MAG: phosphoglycerate mutase family protein [Bdellovibrionota bacterium]
MELILFRHGEKQALGSDPELTSVGKSQAVSIADLVKSRSLPRPTQIYVSPRKRAVQSLQPLADAANLKPKITPDLDQQVSAESGKDFRLRVQEFMVKSALDWKSTDVVYLCSHQDWIMEFLSVIECDTDLLQGIYVHWDTAAFMHFEKRELWHLVKFGRAR